MSELLIKVLGLLLLAAFITVFLKGYNSTSAMLTVIGAVSIVFVLLLKTVFPAITTLSSLFGTNTGNTSYFTIALKSLGIAYISDFAADVCRDFGQNSIAAKAEFAGRCAIFIITVPLITGIAETALNLTKL